MACSHYIDEECKNGFPVTIGCSRKKEEEQDWMMKGVLCNSEYFCARAYDDNGGRPHLIDRNMKNSLH